MTHNRSETAPALLCGGLELGASPGRFFLPSDAHSPGWLELVPATGGSLLTLAFQTSGSLYRMFPVASEAGLTMRHSSPLFLSSFQGQKGEPGFQVSSWWLSILVALTGENVVAPGFWQVCAAPLC